METIDRRGVLHTHGRIEPYLIILHHTVTPTVSSAENGLNSRKGGLGYHFIIDNTGKVYQYADTNDLMYHAAGYNSESIGISFTGGGKYSSVNMIQMNTAVKLILENIKPVEENIVAITCHKHASNSGKIDPRFPGEPENGINIQIDRNYMTQIAKLTGLQFLGHGEV